MKKNNRRVSTVPMLMMRIVVGAYLLYLAYQVFTLSDTEINRTLLICFSVLFLVGGVISAFMGLKDLIKGVYVGGPMDPTLGDDTSTGDSSEAETKQ